MTKPTRPAIRPWCSACWPSVAETCDCEISSSLIGSAPVFSRFARLWADLIVKPPEICEPLDPSMPSGFAAEVDVRDRDQLVVEDDREVLGDRGGSAPGSGGLAALGDLARDRSATSCGPCR